MFKNKGFTLIEVMVSLAILAIALGVIVKGTSEQTNQLAYLKEKTFAYFVAENAISELKVKARMPDKGSTKSTAEMAGHTWYVEQVVTETAAQEFLGKGVFMGVRVEVKKEEDDEVPLAKLQTYFARAMFR